MYFKLFLFDFSERRTICSLVALQIACFKRFTASLED
jgi:hypothetical protein